MGADSSTLLRENRQHVASMEQHAVNHSEAPHIMQKPAGQPHALTALGKAAPGRAFMPFSYSALMYARFPSA